MYNINNVDCIVGENNICASKIVKFSNITIKFFTSEISNTAHLTQFFDKTISV